MGMTGIMYVKNNLRQPNFGIRGVSSQTPTGDSSIAKKATGQREVSSKIPIGWRLETASAMMAHALSGRKWWKAVKIVRSPIKSSGTLAASTGSLW